MELWQAVEELAFIEEEMTRLRMRETELRGTFLRGPQRVEGVNHIVEVQEYRCNVFDRSRLPEEVLTNPAHYRVVHRREVVLSPRQAPPQRAIA
ncbi:hypothetical protein ACFQXB_04040 [Plastorhodobacter daqingensis]|uniref:Uncharacterized protein n=1 Tax=Plastorhodobacter daqingensis TaxID=1387281 RepID=A0ABW2UGP6_9RHOB